MQRRLGEENLTEFVRHYLMKAGQFVKEMDVYSFLKKRVDHDGGRMPIDHLRELRRFADLYGLLLDAGKCEHVGLRERLARFSSAAKSSGGKRCSRPSIDSALRADVEETAKVSAQSQPSRDRRRVRRQKAIRKLAGFASRPSEVRGVRAQRTSCT